MSNILNVIKDGEQGILKYLETNKLKDEDIIEIKKYQKQIQSVAIKDSLKKAKEKNIKHFINSNNSPLGEQNYVLKESLKNIKGVRKNSILDEIIHRANSNKFNISDLINILKNNEEIDVLVKLNKKLLSEYIYQLNFGDLSNEENFNRFLKLQTSTLFNRSIISLNDFSKSFILWNTRKEDIKKAYVYFDTTTVEISDIYKDKNEIIKELVSHYIQYHVSNQSVIWSLSNQKTDYLIERCKLHFKEKMTNMAKRLGLFESLEKLNQYNINELILENSCIKHKKMNL